MWILLRNRMVAAGFMTRTLAVRARRAVRCLGRPRIGRLEHVTIPVKDLAKARRFYCDLLGAAFLMQVGDATFKRFGRPPAGNGGQGAHHISVYFGGTTRIDLFLQERGQPDSTIGHPHYAFLVPTGQLMTWKRALDRNKVPSDGPIQLGPPGQASLHFDDPFGNHLELTCMGFSQPIPIRSPEISHRNWASCA
jgi:catechol 2,3-dioxygenase-like lactoylglutathione lyase family enzyme